MKNSLMTLAAILALSIGLSACGQKKEKSHEAPPAAQNSFCQTHQCNNDDALKEMQAFRKKMKGAENASNGK